jgi:hypothetical protein
MIKAGSKEVYETFPNFEAKLKAKVREYISVLFVRRQGIEHLRFLLSGKGTQDWTDIHQYLRGQISQELSQKMNPVMLHSLYELFSCEFAKDWKEEKKLLDYKVSRF